MKTWTVELTGWKAWACVVAASVLLVALGVVMSTGDGKVWLDKPLTEMTLSDVVVLMAMASLFLRH
jgi:hypothetical protein